MSEHIDEILQLLDGRVLAAYNLPYDWTLMSVEIGSQYDAQFFGICGLVMSRSLDGLFGGHKLEKVCNSRGIDLDNAHSASGVSGIGFGVRVSVETSGRGRITDVGYR